MRAVAAGFDVVARFSAKGADDLFRPSAIAVENNAVGHYSGG